MYSSITYYGTCDISVYSDDLECIPLISLPCIYISYIYRSICVYVNIYPGLLSIPVYLYAHPCLTLSICLSILCYLYAYPFLFVYPYVYP